MQPTSTANLPSTAEYPTPAMPVMGVEFLEDPELRTTGVPSGTAHPVAWIGHSNPTFLGPPSPTPPSPTLPIKPSREADAICGRLTTPFTRPDTAAPATGNAPSAAPG